MARPARGRISAGGRDRLAAEVARGLGSSVKVSRWMMATLFAAATAALPARAPAQNSPPPSATATDDTQHLVDILTNPKSAANECDEAARRLLALGTPRAHRALADLLQNETAPYGRLAAVHALASDPNPDPALVSTLFNLLGPPATTSTEAAADALAAYRSDPNVLTRLINVAADQGWPEHIRLAAVRAVGTFGEKTAAAELVDLLERPNESPTVRDRAADALVEMTGLTDNDRNFQKWVQWWDTQKNQTDAAFRAQLQQVRAARAQQQAVALKLLHDQTDELIKNIYHAESPAERATLLHNLLVSDAPELRALGAQLIYDSKAAGLPVDPAAIAYLRGMVADSSTLVRLQVAKALFNPQDADSITALLAQLDRETDDDVKAEIAGSIAVSQDLRAVDPVTKLMQEPSFSAAEAGAKALAELGAALHKQDPARAAAVARKLEARLAQATGPGSEDLREALVRALASMNDPAAFPTLRSLLNGNETALVRADAIRGIGDLKDPHTTTLIAGYLGDIDAGVRLAAARALANIPGQEVPELVAPAMITVFLTDRDPQVRDQAWTDLKGWFRPMTIQRLSATADALHVDPKAHEEEREVRIALEAALAKDPARGNDLAVTRQQIADLYKESNQLAEAANYYRLALDYWNQHSGAPQTRVVLIQDLLRALLGAGQYDNAVKFAADTLNSDPTSARTVGPPLADAAETLAKTATPQSLADAQTLVTAVLAMHPPLPEPYRGYVTDVSNHLVQPAPATRPAPVPAP